MSNGIIKMANQKYTSIRNDYQLIFDRNSEIVEIEDDLQIPGQGFCFCTINEIFQLNGMRKIDIVGVVVFIGSITQVNSKSTSVVRERRNVTLIDESEKTIEILLWGLNARVNFYSLGQILVIKNARISCHSNKILGSGDEYL